MTINFDPRIIVIFLKGHLHIAMRNQIAKLFLSTLRKKNLLEGLY